MSSDSAVHYYWRFLRTRGLAHGNLWSFDPDRGFLAPGHWWEDTENTGPYMIQGVLDLQQTPRLHIPLVMINYIYMTMVLDFRTYVYILNKKQITINWISFHGMLIKVTSLTRTLTYKLLRKAWIKNVYKWYYLSMIVYIPALLTWPLTQDLAGVIWSKSSHTFGTLAQFLAFFLPVKDEILSLYVHELLGKHDNTCIKILECSFYHNSFRYHIS